jgi:hypothetical protein
MSDDLKAKLQALLKNRNLMTGTQFEGQRHVQTERRRAGDYDLPGVLPGELWPTESTEGDSAFYLVRKEYPLDHLHGSITLGAALAASAEHIAFSACDEELADFDPATACFVDTETIGLAGGAGTVAFLVGVGYFTENSFRLDQCFMRDYDEEEPMLHFLAERFQHTSAVVGYNSKSFDLPLLRTRFIQNRIPFRAEACAHYDLVHAARRFYKRRLSDCSLGNIEREVLGVHRKGDVPSYLIPQMWFDYLRTRDARALKGVFQHHEMDILSLVTLTAWLSTCLTANRGEGFDHLEDKLSLARLHHKQKRYEESAELAKACLESDRFDRPGDREDIMRRECLDLLADAYKRLTRFEEMQEILELAVNEYPSNANARLELVKHYEHRAKNLAKAYALCSEALEAPGRFGIAVIRSEFELRLARLQKKLSKGRVRDDVLILED